MKKKKSKCPIVEGKKGSKCLAAEEKKSKFLVAEEKKSKCLFAEEKKSKWKICARHPPTMNNGSSLILTCMIFYHGGKLLKSAI